MAESTSVAGQRGQVFVGRGDGERAAEISPAQAAQREIAGREVVDAGLEPLDARRDDVDLGLVERAR